MAGPGPSRFGRRPVRGIRGPAGTSWWRGALVALCLLAVAWAPGAALAGATTTTTNVDFPLGYGVWVECTNGGAGELVELDGTLHSVYHVTIDSAGGLHVTSHFNSSEVT